MVEPSINITVEISRKEYEALMTIARRSDRSRAGQVRRWIRQALVKEGMQVDSQGDVTAEDKEIESSE